MPLEAYSRGGVVRQIDRRPQVGSSEMPTGNQSLDTSFDTPGQRALRLASTLVPGTTRELGQDRMLCQTGLFEQLEMPHGGVSQRESIGDCAPLSSKALPPGA